MKLESKDEDRGRTGFQPGSRSEPHP